MLKEGTNTILDKTSGRPEWTVSADDIKGCYEAGITDMCHSISAGLIETWIMEIINDISVSVDKRKEGLNSLAIAVNTPEDENCEVVVPSDVIDCIRNIQEGLEAATIDKDSIVSYANDLYAKLYNAPENLRHGSSDWNRGIKECYDPSLWVHVNDEGEIDMTNFGETDSDFEVPQGYSNCFFLIDSQDNRRISNALAVAPVTTPLSVIVNMRDYEDGTIYFIQSSDNDFLVDAGRLSPSDHPVYFWNTSVDPPEWSMI